MTNYTLTAAHDSYAQTPHVPGDTRPGTLLKKKSVSTVASELARFNRWSENNTNGLSVTYRNFKL